MKYYEKDNYLTYLVNQYNFGSKTKQKENKNIKS